MIWIQAITAAVVCGAILLDVSRNKNKKDLANSDMYVTVQTLVGIFSMFHPNTVGIINQERRTKMDNTPVVPRQKIFHRYTIFFCGSCGNRVFLKGQACRFCGKRIDWKAAYQVKKEKRP